MEPLFQNQYAPFTLSIGFLNVPLLKVVERYLAWQRQILEIVTHEPINCPLPAALMKLEPLTLPPRRILFFSTDSEWTAYFDNSRDGPDTFPPISYLAQALSCYGIDATWVPHTLSTNVGNDRGTYGAVSFTLYGPYETDFLNYERHVGVAFDAKWRFDATGKPLSFEENEKYLSRKLRHRFTPEILARYCNAYGIRVFDENFYTGPGALITSTGPSAIELSFKQARLEMGFD